MSEINSLVLPNHIIKAFQYVICLVIFLHVFTFNAKKNLAHIFSLLLQLLKCSP